MFRKVMLFVINGIGKTIDITKLFILDENLNIRYYNLIIFTIFMTITIRVINFIKGIQEVENDYKNEIKKERSKKK